MNLILIKHLFIKYKILSVLCRSLIKLAIETDERQKRELRETIQIFIHLIVVLLMDLNILRFLDMLVNLERE